MKEEINEALRTLKRIWQRPAQGYVFLPRIPQRYAAGSKNERKKGWVEGRAFDLADWGKIEAHVIKHWDDDLYFTPMVFARPFRTRENAKATSRLWADLDEADPREIDPILYPTIAWETSPGRYAAVWCMGSVRPETTERGGENHRLTIAVGADPSGWDTTQLLRVPGSRNNKKEYGSETYGRLMWREPGSLSWDAVDDLPELPVEDTVGGDLIDEAALESIDPYKAYARLRKSLPGVVRQYMRLKEADETMDRSSIAWQIERSLADAGATLLEMVAILRPTPWNKHYGRRDELKRLMLECAKALAAKKDQSPKSALEADDQIKHKLVPFWNNENYLNAPEPEWLYTDFVPRGGCGFISGIPKSMKTWFAMDLCISASMGVNYLGYQVEKPVNVLYVQREDPTTLVRNRHHVIATTKHPRWALRTNTRDVRAYPGALYVETNLGIDVSDDEWQVWLAEQIRQAKLELVVFDTLVRSAPGVDLDSATAATAQVLNPIKEIARDNDCAIAFVHHNTKAQANTRAAQNMAGTGQIHAWADFGIYITEKREAFDWVEVDFTHETKYTGTRELRFRMEGLPERWDPTERAVEVRPNMDASHPGGTSRAGSSARKKNNPREDDLEGTRAPLSIRIREYKRKFPDATGQEVAIALNCGIRTVRRYLKDKT